MSRVVYGINPVLEALRAGRALRLQVSEPDKGRVREVVRLAAAHGVPISRLAPALLDRAAGGARHQGVVAELRATPVLGVDDLLREARRPALLVVLDGIEDPHNVGAILRAVDAAGADGLIRQTRRAAALDGVVGKTSAGAVAYVKVASVVNLARALDEVKTAGVWVVGLASEVSRRYDEIDLTLPTALVLGAEGVGLRRLVRERCDWLVSIPMAGRLGSLNVSVAAGIALFEAVRQRRQGLSMTDANGPPETPLAPLA